MSTANTLISDAAALINKAQAEHAAAIIPTDLDIDELTAEERVLYASMARMQRLVDANFEQIQSDHLIGINSVNTADKAIDIYTMDYLLDLKLSYLSLSNLCSSLIAAVEKYKVDAPKVWREFAAGNFPYEAELVSE